MAEYFEGPVEWQSILKDQLNGRLFWRTSWMVELKVEVHCLWRRVEAHCTVCRHWPVKPGWYPHQCRVKRTSSWQAAIIIITPVTQKHKTPPFFLILKAFCLKQAETRKNVPNVSLSVSPYQPIPTCILAPVPTWAICSFHLSFLLAHLASMCPCLSNFL